MVITALILIVAMLLVLPPLAAAQPPAPGAQPPADGMDAAMELMKPGPEHQQLMGRVGTWEVSCRMWMKPDEPARESTATAVFTAILDGHFINQDYTGEILGRPFTGREVCGYDRVAKRYVTSWIDSMGTGMMCLSGTSGDQGRTITSIGETACAQDGKLQKIRHLIRQQSADRFTVEMFMTRDQIESKSMELTYTRRK